jgi:hypothetical protein
MPYAPNGNNRNRRRRRRRYDGVSRKVEFFIIAAVRTSNPKFIDFLYFTSFLIIFNDASLAKVI